MRDSRIVRRALSLPTAAEAIGPILSGCEIFGLNRGQFSLIDIIEHCLTFSGRADVIVSTWTASGADLEFAMGFLGSGSVGSVRFLVDFSFPTRQPEYCAALLERFGRDAIRLTKTHAKFVIITSSSMDLVIRSSMNLNENRRLEFFEISDDKKMADYLRGVVDEIWTDHAAGAQLKQTPYEVTRDFETVGHSTAEAERKLQVTARRYFGDGPYDNDLRRIGWSTDRGTVFK